MSIRIDRETCYRVSVKYQQTYICLMKSQLISLDLKKGWLSDSKEDLGAGS